MVQMGENRKDSDQDLSEPGSCRLFRDVVCEEVSSADTVFLPYRYHYHAAGAVPRHSDDVSGARRNPKKSSPFANVQRTNRKYWSPLLPLD